LTRIEDLKKKKDLKYKSLCALCAFSAGFALNNLDKEIRAKAVKYFFSLTQSAQRTSKGRGGSLENIDIKYKYLCALCVFSAGFALKNLDKEIRAKAVKDFIL
jgi:hypothetical protein